MVTSSFSRVTGHVNKVSPGECGANYTGLVFSPFLSFSVLVSSFFPSSFPSSLLPPPSNLPLPPPTPLRNQKLSTPICLWRGGGMWRRGLPTSNWSTSRSAGVF